MHLINRTHSHVYTLSVSATFICYTRVPSSVPKIFLSSKFARDRMFNTHRNIIYILSVHDLCQQNFPHCIFSKIFPIAYSNWIWVNKGFFKWNIILKSHCCVFWTCHILKMICYLFLLLLSNRSPVTLSSYYMLRSEYCIQ